MSEEMNTLFSTYFSPQTSKIYTKQITNDEAAFALRWYSNILQRIVYLKQLSQQISSLHFNNYTPAESRSDPALFARHVKRYNTLTKLFFETHQKFINYLKTNGYTDVLDSIDTWIISFSYTHKTTRCTPYVEINHVPPRTKHTHLGNKKPRRTKKRQFYNCDSLFT